jgi:hypothetical protein
MAMALARDSARPGTLISSEVVMWQIVAFRFDVPRLAARADGGSGVVAGVVETSWTGSATRDAVRHRGAASSAHAGLHGCGESSWTGAGLLITQRSRVQIPPPLLVSAGQGPFPAGRGPFASREL